MRSTLNLRPAVLPPEILDGLPAEHPDASASRRDLRAFNRLLGNGRWFETHLLREVRSGESVLELGAGDGILALQMIQRGIAWDGLDRTPPRANWPRGRRWHQVDLFHFDRWADYPIIAANLVLHHFTDDELRQLGGHLRKHARVIAVSDLHRSKFRRRLFIVLAFLLRANRVSRHDGVLSINAGFRGHELPALLGLENDRWTWTTQTSLRGAYRFLARRKS